MDEHQLIEFLQKSLDITLSVESGNDMNNPSVYIQVELHLANKSIAKSGEWINLEPYGRD